jgi:hypothetical protein
MKCSVCAQEVAAESYAEHLSSEHGVTDDPGAVLLEHLASVRSRQEEPEVVDADPDDWDADDDWEPLDGDDAETDEPEDTMPMAAGDGDVDDDVEEEEPVLGEHDEDDEREPEPTVAMPVTEEAVAAADEPVLADPDADERDLVLPPPGDGGGRRRAVAAGLLAALVLIGAGVAFAVTRDTGSKKHVATRRPAPAPVTTEGPTTSVPQILAGPPPTQPPVVTTVTTPAPAATPPPSGPDPRTQMAFSYADASGCTNGQFDVLGAVTNNSSGTYTFEFTITVFGGDGSPAGTASATAAHLPPGARMTFDPTGSCSQPISGRAPSATITSLTPG